MILWASQKSSAPCRNGYRSDGMVYDEVTPRNPVPYAGKKAWKSYGMG